MATAQAKDLSDFQRAWQGGYFEGDPTDPFSASTYLSLGYVSVLYATYLLCIKPYVDSETTVLEIGPGRGAWTKSIVDLGASKIWALDAATAEHTRFYDYVGDLPQIEYRAVVDQALSDVPDNSIGFFFSFGVFCHLPESIVGDYLRSLPAKMKPGAHGFFLVADFDQHDAAARGVNAVDRLFELKRFAIHRIVHRIVRRIVPLVADPESRWANAGSDGTEWYHIGKQRAAELAREAGFEVLSIDVGTTPRDPILHIRMPMNGGS